MQKRKSRESEAIDFGVNGEPRCLCCGCSENNACEGGCGWAYSGVCTRCKQVYDLMTAVYVRTRKILGYKIGAAEEFDGKVLKGVAVRREMRAILDEHFQET